MGKKTLTLDAKGHQISLVATESENDFISLSDIAKYKSDEPSSVIANWLRNRDTVEFLGLWESLYNPEFNSLEFEGIKNNAGANAFTLSPKKWIEVTNATGIISKGGRYGGTYAHKDIAFEFASWVSAEFKLYIIKEYQRLREEESYRLSSEWNVRRDLSKINYRIHTDSIQENLINNKLTKAQIGITYATEADLLNKALFGLTAREWKTRNSDKKGNPRDYATMEELIVMANLESLSSKLIQDGLSQPQRLEELNKMARTQLKSLLNNKSVKKLK